MQECNYIAQRKILRQHNVQ